MRKLRTKLCLVIGLLWIAGPAMPAEPSEREAQANARWVPGIAIFSMGNPERREAQVSSDAREATSDNSTGFPWSVGGSAELASPVLAEIWGRPRLYIHGDLAYATEGSDPVLNDGVPERPDPDDDATRVRGVRGLGQSLRVETKPLLLTGGLGSIWKFEAFDRTFRVRPSLEWMYQRQTIVANLSAAENEGADPDLCQPCRRLYIDNETEKGYHSLGPGLELEVDAARAGDFMIAFYASGRAYRILGDRRASIGGIGSWQRTDGQPLSTPQRQDTVFRATYERKPWHYRFGFGLRFSWLPD